LKESVPVKAYSLCFVVLAVLAVQGAQAVRIGGTASWTFMVYMDGDNNLDSYAPYSLGMMEEIGSSPNANVLVLWDGLYKPAYMYRVIKGGVEEVNGFQLNGKEVNMGDPDTLEAFVSFAVNKFTAQHYVLVLWDHGNDVSGVCWDEHPEDNLTHPEVALAISKFHIDILAFDACLMAMVEVAYEYNQYDLNSDYLVGCENYVPVSGYPYNAILGDLNQNPAMSELQFAQIIVRDYVEFYKPRAHFNGGVMGTLSAIDLLKIEKVVEDLSEFTKVLMRDMDAAREMIDDARDDGMLPWSEYGWDRYIDLPTFVLNVTLTTDDSAIKLAGDVLQSSLAEAIVALGNTESMESEGARGMGIWFPSSHHSVWGLTTYTETKFAAQGWLDFLYSCWNDYHP
jgi:hypothetical protein